MNIDINEKIKSIKEFLKPSSLVQLSAYFLEHYIRVITFAIILALVGYCVYLWYGAIYRPEWSAEQTRAYIENKSQGTVFDEKGFAYDIAAIKARSEESQKDLGTLTDIFRLRKSSLSSGTTIAPNASVSQNYSSDPDSLSASAIFP